MKWETALWMIACLLFASLPRGQPDTTCHAFVGETVILPCTATSPGELILSNSMLYWQIDSVVVYFSYNGQDSLDFQDQRYRGRTSLFLDQMKHGNFSLKLSNVRLQDAAVYTCIYKQTGDHPSKTQKSKINLIVSAPPSTEEAPSPSARVAGTICALCPRCGLRTNNGTQRCYHLSVCDLDFLILITIIYGLLWLPQALRHSQISSRSPADAPCLAMLPLSFHLLVTLGVWHL